MILEMIQNKIMMKSGLIIFIILMLAPGYLLCQDYIKIADISYTEIQASERQKLDIYIPQNNDALMPCLVWIHGGAWMFGSKNGLAPEIDTLLHHGYVVASIGYRLSDESIFPAQIHDCKSAIRFLKENGKKYKLDSSRIAVAGSSAGGHLASLTGTSYGIKDLEDKTQGYKNASSRVQAVVDFYGPTDFLIMDMLPDSSPDSCGEMNPHLSPESPESLLLGCNIQDCPEKVKFANPVTYISADDPPFLILHGTFDCTVTPLSSIKLEKGLKEKGVPADLHFLPHAGHGGPQFVTPEIKFLVLNFLNDILK
jgi:acetyl esterase/lipase